MASSTTRPIASTKARRVNRFREYPKANRTAKVATRQTGTVSAGMTVARAEPRNRKMTATTSTAASNSVCHTFLMARSMNSELS